MTYFYYIQVYGNVYAIIIIVYTVRIDHFIIICYFFAIYSKYII